MVTVATSPATPATITAARPTREPVPEGAVAYTSRDMAMFWGRRVRARRQEAAHSCKDRKYYRMKGDFDGSDFEGRSELWELGGRNVWIIECIAAA